MKIKFLFLTLFAFICFVSAQAQSVTITPRKVTYKRSKPTADFKKSFVVIYPKVKAATPALSRKIETTISYSQSNLNLKEELNEFQWLDEAGYEVNYNKNNLLDITLSLDGSAAYPSTSNKTIVVNLKTGNRVRPVDVFNDLAKLAAEVRKAQQAEIKKAQAEYKTNPDSADFDGKEYFDVSKFTVKELAEFTVNDQGVTFIYDYGFPHVALALQPEGRYFFSWEDLRPFIKPGGLFAQFVR